jgi:ABC-type Fe3+-siderophore transport system permease subunit
MVLAVMFVPVLVGFFLWGLIAPCCYQALTILEGKPGLSGLRIFSLIVYLGLFYLLARVSFWLSGSIANRTGQKVMQVLFLVLLFSCSFIRVIHESAAGGGTNDNSGTYNFWEACARYPESPRR